MQPSALQSDFPLFGTGDVVGTYFDPASGRHFIVAEPAAQPALWADYLAGAMASYSEHHVESAIEYDRVRDGDTTSLFFAVVETDGRVIGGLRVQGPYVAAQQAHAVREWAGADGSEEMVAEINQRLDEGVIEIKAVWVERTASRHKELVAALARAFVHAMDLLKVRHGMCTAAGHAVTRWQASGGVVSADVAAVGYPDERYQTMLMWWDRRNVSRLVGAEQLNAIVDESVQLLGSPGTTPMTLCSVA